MSEGSEGARTISSTDVSQNRWQAKSMGCHMKKRQPSFTKDRNRVEFKRYVNIYTWKVFCIHTYHTQSVLKFIFRVIKLSPYSLCC